MLNKLKRQLLKHRDWFDNLSQISLDNADPNRPESLFEDKRCYLNFDEKLIKAFFPHKQLSGCDLLAERSKKIYLIE